MPQSKESFLKGRSTQILISRVRGKGHDWNSTVALGDKNGYFVYTLGEIKDELDKRPHISHPRERKKPHKFPKNKRKKTS